MPGRAGLLSAVRAPCPRAVPVAAAVVVPRAAAAIAGARRLCNYHYMSTREEGSSSSSSSASPSGSASEKLRGWFSGRMPSEWFTEAPEIKLDREEITIIGILLAPESGADATDAERAAA